MTRDDNDRSRALVQVLAKDIDQLGRCAPEQLRGPLGAEMLRRMDSAVLELQRVLGHAGPPTPEALASFRMRRLAELRAEVKRDMRREHGIVLCEGCRKILRPDDGEPDDGEPDEEATLPMLRPEDVEAVAQHLAARVPGPYQGEFGDITITQTSGDQASRTIAYDITIHDVEPAGLAANTNDHPGNDPRF